MRLLLVRYGESQANVAGIISDDPARPVALTARGEAQVRAVGEELRAIEFALAFASEFLRARQTAAIILTHQGCDPRIDAWLDERRSGMDGLPVRLFHRIVAPDPVHARPPLGESFLEEIERLRAFLSDSAPGLRTPLRHFSPLTFTRTDRTNLPSDPPDDDADQTRLAFPCRNAARRPAHPGLGARVLPRPSGQRCSEEGTCRDLVS